MMRREVMRAKVVMAEETKDISDFEIGSGRFREGIGYNHFDSLKTELTKRDLSYHRESGYVQRQAHRPALDDERYRVTKGA